METQTDIIIDGRGVMTVGKETQNDTENPSKAQYFDFRLFRLG